MAAARHRPWSLLARFYDELCNEWGIPAMNHHARDVLLASHWDGLRTACDVGCGSGETAVDLAFHGLAVEAIDFAPAHVRATRAKARAAGVRVRARVGDMRSFRLAQPVDLLLCEFAALNNLERRADLAPTLRAFARAVRPGGLLLFDVITPLAFQTQCAPLTWFERKSFKLVQRCTVDDDNRRARLDFDWFVAAGRGRFRHFRETHRNVAWSAAELRAALTAAGFTTLRVVDGVDARPPMDGMTRGTDLYFLCRRAGSTARTVRGRTAANGRGSRSAR